MNRTLAVALRGAVFLFLLFLLRGIGGSLPSWLSVALAIILAVLYPGLVVGRVNFGEHSQASLLRLALAFPVGYSLFSLPSFVSYWFRLSWDALLVLFVLQLFAIDYYLSRERVSITWKRFAEELKESAWLLTMIGVPTIVGAISVHIYGQAFLGDALHHLAYLQKLANGAHIDPYAAMFKGTTEVPYSYAHCLTYVFLSFLARVSGQTPQVLWGIYPTILFPLFVASWWSLFRVFSEEKTTALFFGLCILLSEIMSSFANGLSLGYPDQLARNIVFPALLAVLTHLSSGRESSRNFLMAALLSVALAFTHFYSFVAFSIPLPLFYFFLIAHKPFPLRSLMSYGAAALIILLVVSCRLLNSNYGAVVSMGGVDVKFIKHLASFDSRFLMGAGGLVIVGSLVSMSSRLGRVVGQSLRVDLLLFFIASSATAMLLMKPDLGEFAARFISSTYLRRFTYIGQYPVILGCMAAVVILQLMMTNARAYRRMTNISCSIVALLAVVFLVGKMTGPPPDRSFAEYFNSSEGVFAYIAKHYENEIVCSYGQTALGVVASSNNYTVEVEKAHRPPVNWSQEREDLLFNLLGFSSSLEEHVSNARRLGCTLILYSLGRSVYNTNYHRKSERYFSFQTATYKFGLYEDVYRTKFRDDQYWLLELPRNFDLAAYRQSLKRDLANFPDKSAQRFIDQKLLHLSSRTADDVGFDDQQSDSRSWFLFAATSRMSFSSKCISSDFPNVPDIVLDEEAFGRMSSQPYIRLDSERCGEKHAILSVEFGGVRSVENVVFKVRFMSGRRDAVGTKMVSDGGREIALILSENDELQFDVGGPISGFNLRIPLDAKDRFRIVGMSIRRLIAN